MDANANPFVQNANSRAMVLANSISMRQQIYQETITNFVSGQAMQRNLPLRNVGMVKKLFITITATIAQAAAETLTKTTFGPSNFFSNVTFSDYANYQRINTTGWHLHMLASVKNRMVFGAAVTTDTPTGFGSSGPAIITAPTTITTAQTVTMTYEIPFAYSDSDLTGAVLANVVNANAYLAFTINPNLIVASGANPVQAMYQSSSADRGVMSSCTITVYQDYLDQLPQMNGQLVAPAIDLATVYGIYNTQLTGLAVNQDNPISYANYRRFLSTIAIYDNAGVLSTTSADINRWKLQAANMTNIFDVPPMLVKMEERKLIMDSFPIGSYYFSHRDKPIDTKVNGNMNLIMNPATVTGASSQILIGFEYLALLNQVAQAGSVLQ